VRRSRKRNKEERQVQWKIVNEEQRQSISERERTLRPSRITSAATASNPSVKMTFPRRKYDCINVGRRNTRCLVNSSNRTETIAFAKKRCEKEKKTLINYAYMRLNHHCYLEQQQKRKKNNYSRVRANSFGVRW